MKDFIALCVRRPVMIIMIVSAVLLGGIFSAALLPVDRLPEIYFPRITVETNYPGMGAEEIRSTITIPIEDALSPVKGLEKIRSVSRDGTSIVILDFRWGTNPSACAVLAREAIDAVYAGLPQGASKPIVVSGGSTDEAHAIIGVSSRSGDAFFERNFCEYELRTRLRRIENAGNIILSGGDKKEIHIILDMQKAASRGISPSDLASIIAYETNEVPAGNAREGNMELVVLSSGKPQSVRELSDLVLASDSGPLRLKEIARIEEAAAKKKSIFVFNGKAQTTLEVFRRPGSDPVALSRDLKKLAKETQQQFNRDLEITIVYDAAPEIISSLINLIISMVSGAVAVILVLLFFIRCIRYSILASLSIPVSASVALIALCVFGKSLNSMSLSGLALGIGLVSDTSVIILDVLCRKFSALTERPSAEQIGEETANLSASSFGGAATTAVVFLPILFLPGPLGALFGDLSIAIVFSVIAGWAFAQFVLPVLFRFVFKSGVMPNVAFPIADRYKNMLGYSMQNVKKVIALAAVLSIGGFVFLIFRPASFSSSDSQTEINIKMNYPTGTKLDFISLETTKIADMAREKKFVESVFCRAGAEDEDVRRRAFQDYRAENVLCRCILRKGTKPDAALRELQILFDGIDTTATVQLEYPQDKTAQLLGLSSMTTLALKSKTFNQTEAMRTTRNENNRENNQMEYEAQQIKEKIMSELGADNGSVAISPIEKRPELKIIPFRDVEASLGFTTANVAGITGAVTEGVLASRLEIEGRPYDIRVLGERYSSAHSSELKIEAIPIAFGGDSPIFLGTLGNVQRTEAFQSLARLDRSDVLYIDASTSSKKKTALNKIIQSCIKENAMLSGIDGSTFKRYQSSLIVTIILVLVLLYMTMGAQFESFILPLLFMITIPLSLAGAGPALALSQSQLDSGAVLGIIVLLGIVVNNGIILYESSEKKMRDGLNPADAVREGAADRLKPALATTLTTVIVLIPLIISQGSTQKSMSAAMIGGCVASTALALFVLPPLFAFFLATKGNKT